MRQLRLSKSRYIAGRQCPLQLWYRVYDRSTDGVEPVLWEGVESVAQGLFPGGRRAGADAAASGADIEWTRTLMSDQSCPAIFEAAIAHDRLLAVVDVLQRHDDGWDLIEVKSATGFEPTRSAAAAHPHITYDVAYQREVLRRAGVEVRRAWVYHLNPEYERRGDLDLDALFRRRDVTDFCAEIAPEVRGEIDALLQLGPGSAPVAEPGSRCRTPFDCDYQERCFERKPRHWIYTHLNKLNHHHRRWLSDAGVESVLELDSTNTARLPDQTRRKHLRFRDVYATGRPYIATDLGEQLADLGPPSAYLDFETISPAVPRFDGTRPYQDIPFQYSLHLWSGDGDLEHAEYLAPASGDPRAELALHLAESLKRFRQGPILAYNASFERGCLDSLIGIAADTDPELAISLTQTRDRVVDLLPIVANNVVASGFAGSYSMKAVAPAVLGRESGYQGGEIADGLAARRAFEALSDPLIGRDRESAVRSQLLRYCRLDTLNLYRLHRALGDEDLLARALTAEPGSD